nr:hypothetical protein [Tanacetum cinerariifolium]
MPLLTTLMETCATLSQKVAELEQDKYSQALENLQLKKRVKKLEKKKKSKYLRFKRIRIVGIAQRVESSTDTILGNQEDASKQRGKIVAIDADEGIALVDVETNEEVVAMDAESEGRINQEEVNATSKGVSAAEPTCLSAKRTAWNEFSCSMASAVICLATVVMDNQVDDMTTHNTRYTSPTLTHKVFANMCRVGKGFSGVETPLFASMLVQTQPQAKEEVKYALVVNPTIYVSCIKQFWVKATVKKFKDVVQLCTLIEGKKVVVLEDIIRRDLHLDDADGVKCFPNEEIFKELARMGYEKPPP